ncbi:hypothetical protein MKL09_06725 [Methylobacterium sp. J-048]|uniref:hypothetical protein n=1 Tax=Methylobacterium sp. J-048 TaxID=2836635 RepID=UPI001FBAF77B|nr:hypothetical protein [Methylobacterium sp. J-048]MCJ2056241.1 hypothetical protein [Methylobacterium sp. J-048]
MAHDISQPTHEPEKTEIREDLTMTMRDDIQDYEFLHAVDARMPSEESRMRTYIVASALLICLIGWVLH